MVATLARTWFGLVALGLAAGILSGTLGLGSGIILIPALVMFFGFAQKSAQGTALAVMVPMALLGAILYWRDESIAVDLSTGAIIAAGTLAGVVIGWQFARHLPAVALKRIFAVFLLVAATKMLFFPGVPKKQQGEVPQTQKTTLKQIESTDDTATSSK